MSINKGNSGGPIVNEQGELISVVEWKLFGLGTEGISFSIPPCYNESACSKL